MIDIRGVPQKKSPQFVKRPKKLKSPSAQCRLDTLVSVNQVRKGKAARSSKKRTSTSAKNHRNSDEEDEVRTEPTIHTSQIVCDDSSNPFHSMAVHTDEQGQYMSCPNALVRASSVSQNPEARQAAAILVSCATSGARNMFILES